MPDLEFAVNHYGNADVTMFDFTSMYAAENASKVVERNGHRLLMILVGDSLLEVIIYIFKVIFIIVFVILFIIIITFVAILANRIRLCTWFSLFS